MQYYGRSWKNTRIKQAKYVCYTRFDMAIYIVSKINNLLICTLSLRWMTLWRVECMWRVFWWQLEKKKTDAEIPMLLPKSNSVVSVPRWAANSAFCCNTQVCVRLVVCIGEVSQVWVWWVRCLWDHSGLCRMFDWLKCIGYYLLLVSVQ